MRALFAMATFAAVAVSAAPPPADPTPADAPPAAAAPTVTSVSAEAMARDPRMIAAIRHANAVADRKCGDGAGGQVDLATKAEAQRCRRRMIATAKFEAEGEIEAH